MGLGANKHPNKLKNLEETHKVLDTHDLSKLKPKTWKQVKQIYKSQWDQNSNNKSIIKSPASDRLSAEFYKNQRKKSELCSINYSVQ